MPQSNNKDRTNPPQAKLKRKANPPRNVTVNGSGVTISGMVANCKASTEILEAVERVPKSEVKKITEANFKLLEAARKKIASVKDDAESAFESLAQYHKILKLNGIDADKVYTTDEILAEVDDSKKFSAEVYAPGKGIYIYATAYFISRGMLKLTSRELKPYGQEMLKSIFNHERGKRGLKKM